MLSNDSVEQQVFFTGGFYKRSDICRGDAISWGIVYDGMYDTRWGTGADELKVGQIRGVMGWAWDAANEFGVWVPVALKPIDTRPHFGRRLRLIRWIRSTFLAP